VAVLVGVAAPVVVAVHLNGNATVGVIGPQKLARSELAGSVPARGSAMESAAHLDVLKVGGTIDEQQYSRGIELLERVVAMLTQLIHP
jgi:hypothetical protein